MHGGVGVRMTEGGQTGEETGTTLDGGAVGVMTVTGEERLTGQSMEASKGRGADDEGVEGWRGMSGVEVREGVEGGGGEGDEGMGGDEGAAMSTSCEGGGGEGCTMVDGGF